MFYSEYDNFLNKANKMENRGQIERHRAIVVNSIPPPFEVAAGASENRERGLFPIVRICENKFSLDL